MTSFRATVCVACIWASIGLVPDARAQESDTRSRHDAPDGGRWERRSTSMMVNGIVVTTLNALATVAGGGVLVVGGFCDGIVDVSRPGDCSVLTGIGAATVAGGIAGMSIGIPLWIVGAQRVPAETATTRAPPATVVFSDRGVGLQGVF